MPVNYSDNLPAVIQNGQWGKKIHENELHEFGMEERFLAKDTTNASSKLCASTSFESSFGSLDVDHFFLKGVRVLKGRESLCVVLRILQMTCYIAADCEWNICKSVQGLRRLRLVLTLWQNYLTRQTNLSCMQWFTGSWCCCLITQLCFWLQACRGGGHCSVVEDIQLVKDFYGTVEFITTN